MHVVDEHEHGAVGAGGRQEVQEGLRDRGGARGPFAEWMAEQTDVVLCEDGQVLGQAAGQILDHRERTHVAALGRRGPRDPHAPAPGCPSELVQQRGLSMIATHRCGARQLTIRARDTAGRRRR